VNARTQFGSNLDLLWNDDPRMIGIRMARYKFVAKMLHGRRAVLEIGAGDGRLSRIVRDAVGALDLCDKEPQAAEVTRCDFTNTFGRSGYDAVYALDVLEHVEPTAEGRFMCNISRSLSPYGTCIIGMPSLESQAHALPISRAGHVNCKTEDGLRALLLRYFHCVYLFGMNDETLHTGFGPMCHYRLAIANHKRWPA